MVKNVKKVLAKAVLLLPIAFFIFSCDMWMKSDDFFSEIDDEVFVANAEKINVNVRYADTSQGLTTPNGTSIFKVNVPSEISCSTNNGFGFQRWAAFENIPRGLTYIDEETYQNDFADLELDSSIIEFEDAESETTKVTIHKNTKVVLCQFARSG